MMKMMMMAKMNRESDASSQQNTFQMKTKQFLLLFLFHAVSKLNKKKKKHVVKMRTTNKWVYKNFFITIFKIPAVILF